MWTMWNYTLHLTVLGKDSIICVLVINANYVFIFYWETYVVKILRTVSIFCKNKKYNNIKSEETEKIVEKLLRKKMRLKLGIVFLKKIYCA